MIEFNLNECIMQLNFEEAHRQARFRRLQREAGAGRTGWLEGQRWRALNRLGRLLGSSGQQLLRLVTPRAFPRSGSLSHRIQEAIARGLCEPQTCSVTTA